MSISNSKSFLSFLAERMQANEEELAKLQISYRPTDGPLISVLIRTHNRPEVLRQTLYSLQAQQSKNFEVIVVEDGEETARQLVEESGLPATYFCTGQPVGRCRAGNFAMQKAKGEFFAFLDDDDYFLPWHFTAANNMIARYPKDELFQFGSFELRYTYPPQRLENWETINRRRISNLYASWQDICQKNLFPIQSVVFRRSLYERHGGLDPTLDAYEDWDLWVRFLQDCTPICSAEVTSVFRVIANLVQEAERTLYMNSYRAQLLKKFEDYRCGGQCAREIAQEPPVPAVKIQEDALNYLCAHAKEFYNVITEIMASRRYAFERPRRQLGRLFGYYNFPEKLEDFVSLNQYEAFIIDWRSRH